jgi:hypothetical protein
MKYFKLIDDIYDDQFMDVVLDGHKCPIHLPELIDAGPVEGPRFSDLTFERYAKAKLVHPPASFSISHAGIPVVSSQIGGVLRAVAPTDVQLLEGTLKGTQDGFYLVNLLRQIDCLDRQRSVFTVYAAKPGMPEELVGQVQGIIKMRVDPSKIGDAQIFRAYMTNVIVSEKLWDALSAAGVEGVKVERVA